MVPRAILWLYLVALQVIRPQDVWNSSDCPELAELTDAEGAIASPLFGTRLGYPNNAHCQWRITVPEGQIIKIEIDSLSLEPELDCRFDRLELRDGGDAKSPWLATFCSILLLDWKGNTKGNQLYVIFRSDDGRRYPGFFLRYSAVAKENRLTALLQEEACGSPQVAPRLERPNVRIVGGKQAIPHSWPWQVGIKHNPSDLIFTCGGSIIAPTWILTAAHCLYNLDGARMSPSSMRVFVGVHDLFVTERELTLHYVERTISHPDYGHSSLDNDIGLIQIRPPIQYRTGASSVCLPTEDAAQVPPNATCFATGWGMTEGTGLMTSLNQVELPMYSKEECTEIYGGRFKWDNLCGGEFLKDTCMGDSGGPLVCLHDYRWVLYGLTSWGTDQCGMDGYPGVYTRVSAHLGWITQTTEDPAETGSKAESADIP